MIYDFASVLRYAVRHAPKAVAEDALPEEIRADGTGNDGEENSQTGRRLVSFTLFSAKREFTDATPGK